MAFLMGIIHLLTNVQTFVCHTMTNFLKHLYTWSSQTFIKLFLQIVGQAGPGLVQILCCWTPMRRLGISKRHFTGWKLVVWEWFMYIFINLSVLYDHFKIFVVFMMLPLNIAILSPLAGASGDARARTMKYIINCIFRCFYT